MKRCAISVLTTGELVGTHDIVALSMLQYGQTELQAESFTAKVKPSHMVSIDPYDFSSKKFNREEMYSYPSPMQFKQVFFQWHNSVFFGEKIQLLGLNLPKTVSFLKIFFGPELYSKVFCDSHVDLVTLSEYRKDCGYNEVVHKDMDEGSMDSCRELIQVYMGLIPFNRTLGGSKSAI